MSPTRFSREQCQWPGKKPVFRLVHGFTGCGSDFDLFARSLPYAATASDLPGHGGNGRGDTHFPSFHETAAWLSSTVEDGEVLLGYSLGGRLALDAVIRQNASPRALVLVGASPGLKSAEEQAARRRSDEALAHKITADGIDPFLTFWNAQPLIATQDRIAPAHRAAMTRWRGANGAAALAASLRHHGTGSMPSLWTELQQIRCPVLLLTGAQDPKFGAIAQEMTSRLGHGLHQEVPGAGHCAHLENPEGTVAAITAFLAALDEDER